MFYLLCLMGAAFALQYYLTFRQLKSFSAAYGRMRKTGNRAAIGRFAGKIRAGAVVIFSIDKDGNIEDGEMMQGVTVFARFRPFTAFNGENVADLDEKGCREKHLSISLTRAVTDASYNYRHVMNGEEIPVPPSPLKKAGQSLSGLFASGTRSIRNRIGKATLADQSGFPEI